MQAENLIGNLFHKVKIFTNLCEGLAEVSENVVEDSIDVLPEIV